jgi:DNA-binding GntR family transcriptional regulator
MLARRAAQKATVSDLNEIQSLHHAYAAAVESGDLKLSVPLNIQFHDRIYAVAENPEAVQLLAARTLIVRTVAQSLDAYIPDDRHPIIGEHESILKALLAADVDACDRAVFEHLERARDRLVVRMKKAGLLEAS